MEKRFLSIKELAEYLGMPIKTIYGWIYRRKIPYTKMGKLVKFDLRRIETWADKHTVEPHKR